MPTFATPEPITLVVDLAVGAVTVVASDRADTVVTVRPGDPSKAGDVKTADDARVDLHDGTLTVQTSRSWRVLGPFGGAVDVTVELPTGSALQGSALALFAQGRLGRCSFTSRAGDIRIDEAGRLDVRATAGSVVVGRVHGAATIVATGGGGVRIGEVDGDATIKNTNGYTEIGQAAGSLRVTGAHGHITIGRSSGDTTARCAHGAIRVEEAAAGRLLLASSYGAIEVGVPDGTAAWLDVGSQHGTVRTLLPDARGPGENDRTVEVRASTGYGDVVVRRAHA